MTPEEIINDDYSSEEEKETARKMAVMESQAQAGAQFDDWMRHPAGQKFSKMLESHINDDKNAWLLRADRDAAELVRVQAQVYLKIKQWIAAQIVSGKVASIGLKQFADEGRELEGMIKMPNGGN